VIRKWTVIPGSTLDLPAEAVVCHFAEQHGQPTIWTRDVSAIAAGKRSPYRVWLLPTGGLEVPTDVHLGTAVCANGTLVWHLFRDTL
jgi:hypothetical protein